MVTIILVLLVALTIAVFALKNSSMIVVDLFFTKFEMSQALLILACFAIGIILMFLVHLIQSVRKSRTIKNLDKELAQTKNELENVKAKLAVAEADLRVKTSKTLEQSIRDNRVEGFKHDELIFDEKPFNEKEALSKGDTVIIKRQDGDKIE